MIYLFIVKGMCNTCTISLIEQVERRIEFCPFFYCIERPMPYKNRHCSSVRCCPT